MKKKHIIWIIPVLLLSAIILFGLIAPNKLLTAIGPHVEEVTEFKGMATYNTAIETITMEIDNNFILPVHIDSFNYKMSMMDEKVIESSRKKDLKIPALSNDTIQLQAKVYHKKMLALFEKAENMGLDSVGVNYRGEIYYHIPVFGSARLPFNIDSKMFAYRIPHISITKVEIEDVNLPDVKFNVFLNIENKNPVEFTIKNMAYTMEIGRGIKAEGKTGINAKIDSFDTSQLTVPVEASLGAIPGIMKNFLTEGTTWEYTMNAQATIYYEKEIAEDIQVDLYSKDEFKVFGKK